ncbi:UxaA family hydrolase [Oceanibium sediminis]|uniref:UxaA family hydrolase n=1 Tax=Oceanibium sediminis TaxID=2026339 RepID=UPI000DD4C5C6|nr:UxaA family hydrolase [Oceanibium sediminis]
MTGLIIVDSKDNVATAAADIAAGTTWQPDTAGPPVTLTIPCQIPFGHKIALSALAPGDEVVKYGVVIGVATDAIPAGGHVHVHNIASNRIRGDLQQGGQA